MQIRKFIGASVQDAMEKAKSELGSNAVILHTKKIKSGGVFGLFQKEKVEVLAALEKEGLDNKTPNINIANTNIKDPVLDNKVMNKQLNSSINKPISTDILDNNLNKAKFKPLEIDELRRTHDENKQVKMIDNEIKELKDMLKKLNNKVDISFSNEEHIKNKFKDYYYRLKEKGMSDELIEDILSQVESIDLNDHEFEVFIEKYLLDKFKILGSEEFNLTKKINIFVGATGVGKTTTLAKLASDMVLKEDKKVGFLTLDTYRIAAVDQLKTYGDILNSPVEVAYDLGDVNHALDRLTNRDLVFVDTAGRSYKNKKQMEELKIFLDYFEEKEVFLVLSSNWDVNDIKDILNAYKFLNDYKIIITKLDETSRIGVILDILYKSNKIVTHTTFGQNVPDDIEKFDLQKIVNEVLRR